MVLLFLNFEDFMIVVFFLLIYRIVLLGFMFIELFVNKLYMYCMYKCMYVYDLLFCE